MSEIEIWLKQATRCLSRDSAAQVRAEIQQHYESARETALNGGATGEEADRLAMSALGDARTANRQYRKVLLTSAEARVLGQGNWEARALCAHSRLKNGLLAIPLAALAAAVGFYLNGSMDLARVLLAVGIAMGLLFTAPFLPIYTVSRGRVFRVVRWVALASVLWLAWGPDALKWSWLLFSCLWPVYWIERTRVSIRRKLPIGRWPKQLYL